MKEQSRMSVQAERQAWLMDRMMDRLGLTAEPVSASLDFYKRWAYRTCWSCTHSSECEAWLSHSDKAYVADAPDFCPNASYFRGLHRRADLQSASQELYLQPGDKR